MRFKPAHFYLPLGEDSESHSRVQVLLRKRPATPPRPRWSAPTSTVDFGADRIPQPASRDPFEESEDARRAEQVKMAVLMNVGAFAFTLLLLSVWMVTSQT